MEEREYKKKNRRLSTSKTQVIIESALGVKGKRSSLRRTKYFIWEQRGRGMRMAEVRNVEKTDKVGKIVQ